MNRSCRAWKYACCQTFLEVGWPRRCYRTSANRWACTRVANGITARVPFPSAHQTCRRGMCFDALCCHETPLTSHLQFAYRCRIRCNVWYASPSRKWETRAMDLGSTTVATFLPHTIPLCAEDFRGQRGELMHSGHGLRRFSVWFLLIFRTLRLPIVARNSSSPSSHRYSISSRTSTPCLCRRFLATFQNLCYSLVCGGF
jgi:hypothetical protein